MNPAPALRLAASLLAALLVMLAPDRLLARSLGVGEREVSRQVKTPRPPVRRIAAASGALKLNKSAIDLGTVYLGKGGRDSVAVMNVGDTSLAITSVRIVGGDAGVFSVGPEIAGVVIPPSRFTWQTVTFRPTDTGCFASRLVVTSRVGTDSIPLRACARYDTAVIGIDTLDFGRVIVGGYRDSSVVVRNPGTLPLHLVRGAGIGPFAPAPGTPSTLTIPPGESRSLAFRFSPTQAAGALVIDTLRGDPPGGDALVMLRGEGVAGYSIVLDTVAGAVGDTLTLHLRLAPQPDPSVAGVGWSARLRVDRHALRILGPSLSSSSVRMTRSGDDVVDLVGRSIPSWDGNLAAIDVLGLSTAAPVDPVRITAATLDSGRLAGTSDGLVILSGCIIGNAIPLARRAAILAAAWDASGALTVRYRLPGTAVGAVRVVDMMGRELQRATVPGPGDQERELVVPMGDVPSGVYFVELLVADDRSVMPIMRGR